MSQRKSFWQRGSVNPRSEASLERLEELVFYSFGPKNLLPPLPPCEGEKSFTHKLLEYQKWVFFYFLFLSQKNHQYIIRKSLQYWSVLVSLTLSMYKLKRFLFYFWVTHTARWIGIDRYFRFVETMVLLYEQFCKD